MMLGDVVAVGFVAVIVVAVAIAIYYVIKEFLR